MARWARIGSAVLLVVVLVGLPYEPMVRMAYANGANLSLPFAERIYISCAYGCYDGHVGTDYLCDRGTPVLAAVAGTVIAIRSSCTDGTWCVGGLGNKVEIDHGGGLITRYGHLSQLDFAAYVGQYVYRGQRLANSDHTGKSTRDHLHFEVEISGTMVNPYAGSTQWASGSPIPMGYRRAQDGQVQGPFTLFGGIESRWVALNGLPGAPISDDYPWGGATRRDFEMGYILWQSGVATYYPHQQTYLPFTRVDPAGATRLFTRTTIRNNGSAAPASIVFYGSDGKVVDSRTYASLPTRASWTLDAREIADNQTLLAGSFNGVAIIASPNVSAVAVLDDAAEPDNEPFAYTGIPQTSSPSGIGRGTTLYSPNALTNYYGWNSDLYAQNTTGTATTVTWQYYDNSGYPRQSGTVPLPAWGRAYIPRQSQVQNLWSGWVRLSAGQPIAAAIEHIRLGPPLQRMAYSLVNSGGTSGYLPSIFRQYWTWNSSYQTANIGASSVGARTQFRPPATIRDYDMPGYGHHEEYLDPPAPTPTPLPVGYKGAGYTSLRWGSGPIVTAGQHSSNSTAMGMHGLKAGAYTVQAPLFRDNGTWTGSLTIQNMGSYATVVTVRCYNPNGTQRGNDITLPAINPQYSFELLSTKHGCGSPVRVLPTDFEGSITISSVSSPVGATVQQSVSNDRGYGYAVP